jgi:hypothetical protein
MVLMLQGKAKLTTRLSMRACKTVQWKVSPAKTKLIAQ